MEKCNLLSLLVAFGFLSSKFSSGETLETSSVHTILTIICLDTDCPSSEDNKTRYDHGDTSSVMSNATNITVDQVETDKRIETKLLYGVTAIFSSIFTVLAILVQLRTSRMTHHAKVLLCLTISLFAMYCAFVVRTFVPHENHTVKMCVFAFLYITALSTFFWMSVLAFDLWRVFANLQATPLTHQQRDRRFLAKCAYAWGIPLLICIITICISLYPSVQERLNITMIFQRSWFPNVQTVFIFFYLPLVIILIENITFFLLTIINIKKASCDTEILNRARNKLFKVFVKLFFVMGLCWIMEIMSFLCDQVLKLDVDEAVWYVTDMIDMLQGFFIFLIYIGKRKTLTSIKQWLLCRRKKIQSQLSKSSVKSDQVTYDNISMNMELVEISSPNIVKTNL